MNQKEIMKKTNLNCAARMPINIITIDKYEAINIVVSQAPATQFVPQNVLYLFDLFIFKFNY